MRWTVDWTPNATTALAQAWMQAADPRAVTHAAHEIERLLARDPHLHTIPLSEGLCRITVPPLQASVEIKDRNGSVMVVGLSSVP